MPRKSVQELYHRHDRDSLECFQAQEMTVSGDDNIGPGLECARQENAVGRVLRDGVTDIQMTGHQYGVLFQEIEELPDIVVGQGIFFPKESVFIQSQYMGIDCFID